MRPSLKKTGGRFAFVKEFLSRELPEAVMYIPEATYLAWVDMSKCLPNGTDLPDFFANKAGVLLEGGNALFVGNAAGYIRLNLAMPRSIIETGLQRMADAIRKRAKCHVIHQLCYNQRKDMTLTIKRSTSCFFCSAVLNQA